MQTKVRKVALSEVKWLIHLQLFWSQDSNCAFLVLWPQLGWCSRGHRKAGMRSQTPPDLLQEQARVFRSRVYLNLLPPDYKPTAAPISWATLHICDSEGTGPLSPVGSPAPSTSPCCCSWAAVVGWPGSGWPQPAPWTKVVCTHVISANYPGFSKLADSRRESQAARSRCPAGVSPLHPATAGLNPNAKDFTSPGCVCPHRLRGRQVLASECLCVSAAVHMQRPLRQVWEAELMGRGRG